MEQVINGTFNSCEIADLCLFYLYKSRTVQYILRLHSPHLPCQIDFPKDQCYPSFFLFSTKNHNLGIV